MQCPNCKNIVNDDARFCTFCGNQLESFKPECFAQENVVVNDGKKKTKALKIVLITLSSLLSVLIAFGCFWFLKTTDSTGREYTAQEISEICDMLDYSALCATVENYSQRLEQSYVYDADNDGRKELFITSYNDIYEEKPVIFAFDTIDNGTMASATHFGAAGSAKITNEYSNAEGLNNGLLLEWGYYSSGVTSVSYEEWTNSGWNQITEKVKNAKINDAVEKTDIGCISHHKLMSKYYDAQNHIEIVNTYKDHLTKWWGDNYIYVEDDIDSDDENEFAFVISDFGKLWAENLTTTGTDGSLMEDYIAELEQIGTVIILADADDDGIVFHTFFIKTHEDEIIATNFWWEESELSVELISEKEIQTEYFFCANVEYSRPHNALDEKSFNIISNQYIEFLRKHSYEDILLKYADVCEAPGEELVCVCADEEVDRVNVYAMYCGRMVTLYYQDFNSVGAVFLVESEEIMKLLNYNQGVFSVESCLDGTYFRRTGKDYRFWLISFDENYIEVQGENQSVVLYDDETPTESDKSFFVELNKYLDESVVCVDNYELTGYRVMPSIETDSFEAETDKYLSISNCDINKMGEVKVESWLNFREGPDISYDKILLDYTDPESFVKQVNGSPVTIIDTVNTGDEKNPIWVKIQIKYSDKTLVGYSSQSYIDIPNIKHINVGDSFTVEANTNDGDLYWTSNDENVLSVDASTGEIVGKRKGLAIVSVESESGLTDSCLIMVD